MPFVRSLATDRRSQLSQRKSSFKQVEFNAPWMVLALTTALLFGSAQTGWATRPPEALKTVLQQTFPKSRVRLDGVIERADGVLYIPLIPKTVDAKAQPGLAAKYPTQAPILYAFSNGWYYLKLVDKNGKKILGLPVLKDEEKKKIAQCSLPSDLIVPNNMFVSPELKHAVGELAVAILGGDTPAEPAGVSKTKQQASEIQPSANQNGNAKTANADAKVESKPADSAPIADGGIVAITSPQTGKVAMLGNALNKLSELPTDGTPGGMAYAGGKLYIADQTKNRVLIVDPKTREFAGQIDFPPGSSPKDVAVLADGTFLYVSECAANKVAIVELASKKILMHTLVPAGPTRLAITPNGYTLIILNVPAGKVSFLSTLNQKLVGILPVGGMPSDIAISNNSKTAYVSNRLSNTVSVIDITQRKVIRTLQTGEGPTGIALTRDGSRLFVANAKENSISVFDLATNAKVKDVSLPIDVEFPSDIMLLPDGHRMLVSSAATDTLGMLNIESLEFEKQPTLGCTSVNLIWVPQ